MKLPSIITRIASQAFVHVPSAISIVLACLTLGPATGHAQQGVPLWTNRLDDGWPAAVAVDANDKVYVTGVWYGNDGAGDITTIAYSGAGVVLWTNSYDGPANDSDEGIALAVDASNNVVVVGCSTGVGSSSDFTVVKYASTGELLWTSRYDGTANDEDRALAVAVDKHGNVFVTGYSLGVDGSLDCVTLGYTVAGVPLWTNRYNGTEQAEDQALAIALDVDGNPVVTGFSIGANGMYDFITIKYSHEGVPLWTNRYDGLANAGDVATAVAIGPSGIIYVTGVTDGGVSSGDFGTIAYMSNGTPAWTNFFNRAGNAYDEARAARVDGDGNLVVTGFSTGAGSLPDFVTIKYSAAGVPLWTNVYNSDENMVDSPNALAMDACGNVFVTGGAGPGASRDYATVAYAAAGTPLWTNRFNEANDSSGVAVGIAVDTKGNVIVAGVSITNNSHSYATVKYSSTCAITSTVPTPLMFAVTGNQLVLSWTNALFSLQSSPTVKGNYTNVLGALSPYTNSISGRQQYFRLKAN